MNRAGIFALLVPVLALTISCSGLATKKETAPEPMIVDTDGAVFWDDGAALAMLLRRPDQFEIVGITTVIGNHWPHQAAEYVARVLKAAGRTDIPIYVGAARPLLNGRERMLQLEKSLVAARLVADGGFWKGAYNRPKEVRSASEVEPVKGEGLSGLRPRNEDAVDFIAQTLAQADRPVTFVALGPLTNLALALRKSPTIAAKIGRLLFMGGNVKVAGNTSPSAELNFLFDPEAAALVLSASIREKTMFPLDLSAQGTLDKARYEKLAGLGSVFATMLEKDRGPKFNDPKYVVQSWDTTVAAYLIDPDYITGSTELALRIVTDFGSRYGAVEIVPDRAPNVRVMTRMDTERFFSILQSAFAPSSLTRPPRRPASTLLWGG